ncbi:Hypothetical predicted protein [Pelobates cultripes]|uniref:Uncharacterized protein n=1 Tax=Pelobates cultripes TaxID=61616 RepID=A0AAD1W843_PELCU|nr:Hypothetical predicted protein [Pelobates cultripes]
MSVVLLMECHVKVAAYYENALGKSHQAIKCGAEELVLFRIRGVDICECVFLTVEGALRDDISAVFALNGVQFYVGNVPGEQYSLSNVAA